MSNDRITEIRVQGLRSLHDVRLKLNGLTVLIGENGSGKSSLIEAFEILRKATEPEFLSKLSYAHGGMSNLLRHGAARLTFDVTIDGDEGAAMYSLALGSRSGVAFVDSERLTLPERRDQYEQPVWIFEQTPTLARYRQSLLAPGASIPPQFAKVAALFDAGLSEHELLGPPEGLLLNRFGHDAPHPAISRVRAILGCLHVQLPFAIRPYWTSRELGDRFFLRDTATLAPAASLGRSAENLFSCFYKLKNEPGPAWSDTLALIRLGLGEDVEDVILDVAGGGKIDLALRLRGQPALVYGSSLSDGQLAYLAFVALSRLPGDASVIALDEPDAHLHPHLVMRVLGLLEELAEQRPVVLATHSDRLLDALPDPVESVVLCELNRERATELRRPNAEALARWLQHYRGLGAMRAEGVDKLVVTERD